MPSTSAVSPLSLNRLSLYLRSLRELRRQGLKRISSQELADRFHLSAALIRKDLAQFGEFGIRGIGYEIDSLISRLDSLLGLDREHRIIVVGMGSLGVALTRYLEGNRGTFRVVAGLDEDKGKVGKQIGRIPVHDVSEVDRVVRETGAEIAMLTLPPESAQATCDDLARAGIRAILNFAPVQIQVAPSIPTKSVDVQVHLEELAFFLRA